MTGDSQKLAAALLRREQSADAHAEVFGKLGFGDPAKAASLWRSLVDKTAVASVGPGSPLEAHVSHLIAELTACPDPDMALLNLGRFVDASISPSQFFGSILLERPLVHLLVVIFSCSYYLSDILTRNPGYISWLIQRETLEPLKSYRTYRDELASQIAPFTDRRRRLNSIKRFRRREVLRIGTRDLLGLATVEEITSELSFLADAVVTTVARLAWREEAKHSSEAGIDGAGSDGGGSSRPRGGGDGGSLRPRGGGHDGEPLRPQRGGDEDNPFGDEPFGRFAVVAMGKLGGSELNFSSDIDLMYVCGDGAADAERQFYTALAQRITRDLSEPTEEGYLYRVDLRLRPDGESGPLVVTTGEHMNYLLGRARPWERQALLKARYSAGSRAVADALIDSCARVIFSTLDDADPLPDILAMRESAIARLTAGERRGNIKLMSGGIRDIEFITQALQLVHGRSRSEVRSRNTLEALERLHHYGLIEDEVLNSLVRAYRLFRTVEHRLQMLLDARTHTLPAGDGELACLGARVAHGAVGGITADTFRTELGRSIRRVRKLFDSFFRERKPGEISLILSLPPGERAVSRLLSRYGIGEGETAHRFLSSLVYGDFPALEGPETLHAAAAALPRILEAVGRTPDPTLTLKNLVRIVKSTGAVRSTLELLADGGDLLRLLLVIAGLSTRLTEIISQRPELLDALAAGMPPAGPAAGEDRLVRDLKHRHEETVLSVHCRYPIPRYGASTLGPLYADALESAVRVLYAANGGGDTPLALFALGSLAARRIGAGSDLDLLAIIPDEADPRPAASVLQGMIAGARRAGLAPVDPRLRGEGDGSPLVRTLDYYRRYFESRADFWEILTFSRCRFLCGDETTAASFERIVRSFHERDDVRKSFKDNLLAARCRLERLSKGAWDVKHAPGGLYDINFILAAANLIVRKAEGRAIEWDDSTAALRSKGLLKQEEIDRLARAFDIFYLTQHAVALHAIAYPPLPEREEFLESYLGRLLAPLAVEGAERFANTLEYHRNRTRDIFNRIFSRGAV